MQKNGVLFPLIIFTFLIFVSIFSWYLSQAPSSSVSIFNQSTESKSDFSVKRAMKHVEFLAKEPHGGGSLRLAELRDYLVKELEEMGFETKIQRDILSAKSYGFQRSLYVQNVIGTRKGSGSKGKAIALMSHYDSQPHTPGAADDICGVAAILEAARAIIVQGHEHDLMLIITDGEEAGLVGAKVFVANDPQANEIALLLNFEARGNKGVVSTFEIFGNVDWLIPEYAKALDHPFANSISYEVYKRMPNDTDFSVTRKKQIPGFNFALIGGHAAYHSMIDTPENLDKGSLAHMGEYAFNLTTHFDQLNLSQAFPPEKNDIIFFNPAGYSFLHFPSQYLMYALVFCAFILIGLLFFGMLRKQYTLFYLFKALFLWLILLTISLGLSYGVSELLKIASPEFAHFNMRGLYPLQAFALAFTFLMLSVFLILSCLFLKVSKPFSLHLAGIILWFVLSVVSFVYVPGASYLFIYPLIFASLGALIQVFLGIEHWNRRMVYGVLAGIFSIPILLFLVPIISLLHDSFGIYMVLAPVLVTVLLFILLFPLFELIVKSFGVKLSFAAMLMALLFFVGAKFYYAPSEKYPLQSSMIYLQDSESKQAWWASEFGETDFWNDHYLKDQVDLPQDEEWMKRMKIAAKAPLLNASAPIFTVVVDTVIDGRRTVAADLEVEKEVAYLGFQLAGEQEMEIEMSDIPRKNLGAFDYLQLVGLPDNRSMRLYFDDVKGPLELEIYTQKIGLPKELLDKPMPPEIIPGTGYLSHINILKNSFVIE